MVSALKMPTRARPKPGRTTRKPHSTPRAPKAAQPTPAPARPQPAPPAPLVDARAIAMFEQGMASLQKHAYGAAAETFKRLIDQFPGERALLERTRVYLELCERELRRKPAAPKTVEERLTAATAALNNDDDPTAARLVKSVLDADANHDLALYLMAAVEARRGDATAAMAFLTRAFNSNPEVRAQARHDDDFELLRGLDAFKALVEPPPGAGGFRRGRRR